MHQERLFTGQDVGNSSRQGAHLVTMQLHLGKQQQVHTVSRYEQERRDRRIKAANNYRAEMGTSPTKHTPPSGQPASRVSAAFGRASDSPAPQRTLFNDPSSSAHSPGANGLIAPGSCSKGADLPLVACAAVVGSGVGRSSPAARPLPRVSPWKPDPAVALLHRPGHTAGQVRTRGLAGGVGAAAAGGAGAGGAASILGAYSSSHHSHGERPLGPHTAVEAGAGPAAAPSATAALLAAERDPVGQPGQPASGAAAEGEEGESNWQRLKRWAAERSSNTLQLGGPGLGLGPPATTAPAAAVGTAAAPSPRASTSYGGAAAAGPATTASPLGAAARALVAGSLPTPAHQVADPAAVLRAHGVPTTSQVPSQHQLQPQPSPSGRGGPGFGPRASWQPAPRGLDAQAKLQRYAAELAELEASMGGGHLARGSGAISSSRAAGVGASRAALLGSSASVAGGVGSVGARAGSSAGSGAGPLHPSVLLSGPQPGAPAAGEGHGSYGLLASLGLGPGLPTTGPPTTGLLQAPAAPSASPTSRATSSLEAAAEELLQRARLMVHCGGSAGAGLAGAGPRGSGSALAPAASGGSATDGGSGGGGAMSDAELVARVQRIMDGAVVGLVEEGLLAGPGEATPYIGSVGSSRRASAGSHHHPRAQPRSSSLSRPGSSWGGLPVAVSSSHGMPPVLPIQPPSPSDSSAAVAKARVGRMQLLLRRWRRAVRARKAADARVRSFALRTRAWPMLRAWRSLVRAGRAAAAALELEEAREVRREQVADRFRRLWLLHAALGAWRGAAATCARERFLSAAAERQMQAEVQAEARREAAALRFCAASLQHRALTGWVCVARAAAAQRLLESDAARRKSAIAGFLERVAASGIPPPPAGGGSPGRVPGSAIPLPSPSGPVGSGAGAAAARSAAAAIAVPALAGPAQVAQVARALGARGALASKLAAAGQAGLAARARVGPSPRTLHLGAASGEVAGALALAASRSTSSTSSSMSSAATGGGGGGVTVARAPALATAARAAARRRSVLDSAVGTRGAAEGAPTAALAEALAQLAAKLPEGSALRADLEAGLQHPEDVAELARLVSGQLGAGGGGAAMRRATDGGVVGFGGSAGFVGAGGAGAPRGVSASEDPAGGYAVYRVTADGVEPVAVAAEAAGSEGGHQVSSGSSGSSAGIQGGEVMVLGDDGPLPLPAITFGAAFSGLPAQLQQQRQSQQQEAGEEGAGEDAEAQAQEPGPCDSWHEEPGAGCDHEPASAAASADAGGCGLTGPRPGTSGGNSSCASRPSTANTAVPAAPGGFLLACSRPGSAASSAAASCTSPGAGTASGQARPLAAAAAARTPYHRRPSSSHSSAASDGAASASASVSGTRSASRPRSGAASGTSLASAAQAGDEAARALLAQAKAAEARRRRVSRDAMDAVQGELLEQAGVLADLHYTRGLMLRRGLQPWLVLLSRLRAREHLAATHYQRQRVRMCWGALRRRVAARHWATASSQAAAVGALRLRAKGAELRRRWRSLFLWWASGRMARHTMGAMVFGGLRTAVAWSRLATRDARLWRRRRLQANTLRAWLQAAQALAAEELMSELQAAHGAEQHLARRRKRAVLGAWRAVVEGEAEAREAEARKAATLSKISGWLREVEAQQQERQGGAVPAAAGSSRRGTAESLGQPGGLLPPLQLCSTLGVALAGRGAASAYAAAAAGPEAAGPGGALHGNGDLGREEAHPMPRGWERRLANLLCRGGPPGKGAEGEAGPLLAEGMDQDSLLPPPRWSRWASGGGSSSGGGGDGGGGAGAAAAGAGASSGRPLQPSSLSEAAVAPAASAAPGGTHGAHRAMEPAQGTPSRRRWGQPASAHEPASTAAVGGESILGRAPAAAAAAAATAPGHGGLLPQLPAGGSRRATQESSSGGSADATVVVRLVASPHASTRGSAWGAAAAGQGGALLPSIRNSAVWGPAKGAEGEAELHAGGGADLTGMRQSRALGWPKGQGDHHHEGGDGARHAGHKDVEEQRHLLAMQLPHLGPRAGEPAPPRRSEQRWAQGCSRQSSDRGAPPALPAPGAPPPQAMHQPPGHMGDGGCSGSTTAGPGSTGGPGVVLSEGGAATGRLQPKQESLAVLRQKRLERFMANRGALSVGGSGALPSLQEGGGRRR